jgi:threonyl-tRNA synthetase
MKQYQQTEGELWDMHRPFEGSCVLKLLKFDDEEGKMVFWHSSAHVLGEVLERVFGSYLTIGNK